MEQETSPKTEIYGALSAMQKELKPFSRTVTVDTGKYKYSYTPLDEIMKELYPMLGKNGLSVRHEITEKGVDCVLSHKSGEELRSGAIEVPSTGSMQMIGGAITYARRYTLTMLLGIASEEDTDVKGLSVPDKKKTLQDEAQHLDVSQQATLIRGAKSTEELKKIWTGLAPAYRENVELLKLKDEVKSFLMSEEKDIITD
jgi:hypothetical protein